MNLSILLFGVFGSFASKLLESSLELGQLLLHGLGELPDNRIILRELFVFLDIALQFCIPLLVHLIPTPEHAAFILKSFDLFAEYFSASVPVVILIEDLLKFIEGRVLLLAVLVLAVVLDVDEVLVEGLGRLLLWIFVVHL